MKLEKKHFLYTLIILLALIVLPTGTPEDLFTTVVIVKYFGITGYILIAVLVYMIYKWVRRK